VKRKLLLRALVRRIVCLDGPSIGDEMSCLGGQQNRLKTRTNKKTALARGPDRVAENSNDPVDTFDATP
jgi:hypothetical protein